MSFLDGDYLFDNLTAGKLYKQVENLPIIDPHNHGDVKEIIDNKGWGDIWEVEGATDHYVWELMRKRGIREEKITGKASNKEKWMALAKVFPQFAGNPSYEWIHLDLKRRFNINKIISEDSSEMIWEKTSEILQTNRMKPREVLKDMNVQIMCTTDDPNSALEYHKSAKKEIEDIKILPTWRPDNAMNIGQETWRGYVEGLINATGISGEPASLEDFLESLQKSHNYFAEHGCVASDHGLFEPYSYFVTTKSAAYIHQKAFSGQELTLKEIKDYKAFMLYQFAKMNEGSNWVTQLHIGPVRNYRNSLYYKLGPDTGGDISTLNIEIVDNISYFLNEFEDLKVVLYCLDPGHLPTIATIARAFPNVSIGAAWWFNDSPYGMEEHLKYIATVDLLSNQAGMVTDSRKLMSFGSRTEMFRRSLCNVMGRLVEKGQVPESVAVDLVKNISYYRPLNLFFIR